MPDAPLSRPTEKLLSFEGVYPYETLNDWGATTQRVWVVFHGIGFLSRYFLRYFTHLDPAGNYIIAPQAPSLCYLDKTYRHVGASWLTREHTARNMKNLLNYLEALYRKEHLAEAPELVLMGYSQGVSVLCRWLALGKIACSRVVLYAGRVPDELGPEDFDHLPPEMVVEVHEGDSDAFLPLNERPVREERLRKLFGDRLQLLSYPGGHELLPERIRA